MLQFGRSHRGRSALQPAPTEKEIHFQIDVFPLLSLGLLPGAADRHGEQRSVQSSPARPPIPRAVHTVAAADDGVLEGGPATHVERALQDLRTAQAHGCVKALAPSRDACEVRDGSDIS